MSYAVFIQSKADKQLGKLPQDMQERLDAAIDGLADDPRPPNSRKLKGRQDWRLRVGEYRIIYGIDDEAREVLILAVTHRREAYR